MTDPPPASGGREAGRSAYLRLQRDPRRFRFDAAVRLLLRLARSNEPAEAMRFRTSPGLAYPASEVANAQPGQDGGPPQVTVGLIGLTGSSGVLPRYYSEVLAATLRGGSRALHAFLDLLAHRSIGHFAQAGIKYRLHRAAETAAASGATSGAAGDAAGESGGEADKITMGVLALTGYGTPNMAPRLAAGPMPLLHYAGLFAMRPRSVDRLTALVSDWLGRPVQVEQFAGSWLFLPPDQRSRMPAGRQAGAWSQLGVDAAVGVRAWDPQARIILRVGPLDRAAFEALLPDRPGLRRLVSLVRAYLGFETGFAVNPILARAQVPALRLDPSADPAPRLGWNSWIPGPPGPGTGSGARPRPDADEAIFEAETVEMNEPRP